MKKTLRKDSAAVKRRERMRQSLGHSGSTPSGTPGATPVADVKEHRRITNDPKAKLLYELAFSLEQSLTQGHGVVIPGKYRSIKKALKAGERIAKASRGRLIFQGASS